MLEFAYDDWCIARMAQEMGKDDIYQKYIQRSQNYINVFDGNTKFFRPKRMDGNWETPFNPIEVGLPIRKPQPGSIASLYLTM